MEPAKEVKTEVVSTEGMEQIFEEVPSSRLAQEEERYPYQEPEEAEQVPPQVEAIELVPASYAATKFGKTRRYISKLANEGRIKAEKNDKNQWMVVLESVQEFFQGEGTKDKTVPKQENKETSPVRSILDQERIRELESKNRELEQEVRNSHFRLGYFESEMANRQERIRLLEDKQAKAYEDSERLREVQHHYAILEDEKYSLEEKYREAQETLKRYKEREKRSSWKKFSDWMIGKKVDDKN